MLTPYQWKLFALARRKLSRWWNPPLPSGEPPSKTIAPTTDRERFLMALAMSFEVFVIAALNDWDGQNQDEVGGDIGNVAVFICRMRDRGFDAVPFMQEGYRDLIARDTPHGLDISRSVIRLSELMGMYQEEEGTIQ